MDKKAAYITIEKLEGLKSKVDKEAARVALIFELAKKTGEPQELKKYQSDACTNGNDDQCSFDTIYILALPDGTTKRQAVCCF